MDNMQRVAILMCAALLLLPALIKSRKSQLHPALTAFSILSGSRVTVKISGDVAHPGIYQVSANKMAESVIIMAVPEHPLKRLTANPPDVRLHNGSAFKLTRQPDGSHLLTSDIMTASERLTLGVPLDISTMNEADFDRLPGIGPALAKRITQYRQNNGGSIHLKDLQHIEGIGRKKFEQILVYF